MNYFHDVYLGFLAEQIARQCEQLSMLKCSACESKIKSPLLHICHQRGLLEKLQVHFEEVRGPMLTSIEAYYDQVQELLPHSDDVRKIKQTIQMLVAYGYSCVQQKLYSTGDM